MKMFKVSSIAKNTSIFLPFRAMLTVYLVLLITCIWKNPGFPLTEDTRDQLSVFAEALSIVEDNHVEPKETKKLIYGAIKGMVGSLDAHSSFMAPEEFKELQ